MQQSDLAEAQALERKRYTKLAEVLDLTQQLAEAVDREDAVTVRLLLSMRQGPIYELQEIEGQLELKECDLTKEDAARLRLLLKGEAPDPTPEEEGLLRQVEMNRRSLQRVVELDRRVSLKLAGEHSCYK